ncbi:MAG: hypothetical protein XD92_0879, partial [Proteiniphilum acetatigenes]
MELQMNGKSKKEQTSNLFLFYAPANNLEIRQFRTGFKFSGFLCRNVDC